MYCITKGEDTRFPVLQHFTSAYSPYFTLHSELLKHYHCSVQARANHHGFASQDSNKFLHHNISFLRPRNTNNRRYNLHHAHTDCVPQSQQSATIPSERQILEHIICARYPPRNQPARQCDIPRNAPWAHRDSSHTRTLVSSPGHDGPAPGVDLRLIQSLSAAAPSNLKVRHNQQRSSRLSGTMLCLFRSPKCCARRSSLLRLVCVVNAGMPWACSQ